VCHPLRSLGKDQTRHCAAEQHHLHVCDSALTQRRFPAPSRDTVVTSEIRESLPLSIVATLLHTIEGLLRIGGRSSLSIARKSVEATKSSLHWSRWHFHEQETDLKPEVWFAVRAKKERR